jgi:hypothetical protein
MLAGSPRHPHLAGTVIDMKNLRATIRSMTLAKQERYRGHALQLILVTQLRI